jgi:hypothetical protein
MSNLLAVLLKSTAVVEDSSFSRSSRVLNFATRMRVFYKVDNASDGHEPLTCNSPSFHATGCASGMKYVVSCGKYADLVHAHKCVSSVNVNSTACDDPVSDQFGFVATSPHFSNNGG